MKTSKTVLDLGLYASNCCGEELIFDTRDTFCRCPRCQQLCEWELIEPVVPAEELEKWEEQAVA